MKPICLFSAYEAPPITLQSDRVRRRISASSALAAVIAGHAFGSRQRGDLATLANMTSARVASYAEARS